MIIKRQYEWLGILYDKDPDAKKIIDEALKLGKVSRDWKKKILEYNHSRCPAFYDMGCGIPGESYTFIMNGLEKLDNKSPYDNGLMFLDVTDIEYETSRKGTAIQLRLVNRVDGLYRIVGFVTIEDKDGILAISKGWLMYDPLV